MATTPTTQWTRNDEPILGVMSPAYLAEDADGVLGISNDVADATHQFELDTSDDIVGVESFTLNESLIIERNNALVLARVNEV